MPVAAFWDALQRFLASLYPPLSTAFVLALRQIREQMPDAEVTRLVAEGDAGAVAALILSSEVVRVAFSGLRNVIRDTITKSALRFAKDIPPVRSGGNLLAVEFDILDTRTVAAVKAFEKAVLDETGKTLSEAIVSAVEDGLARGVNPRTIARGLRDVVGLTNPQEVWVRNFRDELIRGDAAVFDRKLLDKRFVATIKKAFANDGLTSAQIDKMVDSYRSRMIAHHATDVARTVAINSMKLGQIEIWQQAIDQGVVNADDLEQTWRTKLDGRERKTHHDLNGTMVKFGERWYVPGVGFVRYPGEREFNCRCAVTMRVRSKRPSERSAA